MHSGISANVTQPSFHENYSNKIKSKPNLILIFQHIVCSCLLLFFASEYNETFRLQINRKSKGLFRYVERKGIKVEIFLKR